MAKTKLIEKIGYGFGDMSSSTFWKVFSYYLPIFYSNIFGLSLIDAGVLVLVTRIWDAVSDPMMGIIADRTNTKWGKYRPYLLWVAPFFSICGILLFTTIVLSLETTTMDIHHYRQGIVDRSCWSDDTQIQAILTHHVVRHIASLRLWGPLGNIFRLQHTLPGLGRLWSLPSQFTNRRSRKGYSFVDCEVTIEDTLHITRFHMGLQQRLSLCSRQAQ